MASEEPLWRPSAERVAQANLSRFIAEVNRRHGLALEGYGELHRWSVENAETFWSEVWEQLGVIAETRGERAVADKEKLPGAQWFPDARLNFAENLMRPGGQGPAMIFRGEDRVAREISRPEMAATVSRLAQALQASGVGPGDRVAAFLPNLPETVMAMLATASLGAIWSSCSPDFGVPGVVDRFGQIEPKVLVVADGYWFNGRHFDTLEKARAMLAELPTVERVVLVPYTEAAPSLDGLGGKARLWDDFISAFEPGPIAFRQMPFNAPLYILYSSGTTGKPKCIVHGAGGTLMQHLKEHQLNSDIKPGDRLFYFTTCGWMMWNWLVSSLASGASLVLYDGSPFHPDGNALFDLADAAGVTHFGASAKYLDALAKAGIEPARTHDLSSVRVMLSTGSPLSPQGFRYVYDEIKADLHLASVSGGTDIVSCFVCGDPTGPVWPGEIQALGLGMDVAVFDEAGNEVVGQQGELVCRNAFPSMPVGFWADPDGARYREAYFEHFPGVWRHGDWVEITPHGGMVIYGRSDATLNPGGVRIGTAEIYRQVEALDEVVEGMVIGQAHDDDVRVVLFVILREGVTLDDALRDRIRQRIRQNASPRHVPAKIVQVADIPRTVNGKITELAVADVVHGRPVKNKEALANPEALTLYEDLPELRA